MQKIQNKPKKLTNALMAGVMALSLGACDNEGEVLGTLIGGALGAWAGTEIGGNAGEDLMLGYMGAAIGASIGNSVGRKMDEHDRMMQRLAYQEALETSRSGRRSTWYNPDSGNSGSITPKAAYKKDNRYCREYTQTVTIAGNTENAYGTACRMPDGSWKIS
jgi:surface antigen